MDNISPTGTSTMTSKTIAKCSVCGNIVRKVSPHEIQHTGHNYMCDYCGCEPLSIIFETKNKIIEIN